MTQPTKLSGESSYVVDVVMWLKLGNFSFFCERSLWTQFYKDLAKKHFFERYSWFKINNLELAQSMAEKVYAIVAKGLKLK